MNDTLALWHQIVAQRDPSRLPEIVAQDCVFHSPVVHTPQRGRDLTVFYLTGAVQVLGAEFRYLREVVDGPHAVLEFISVVDGIEVNGVDMITIDADGLICDFKVMVRPLKAINLLHEKMRAALAALGS